MHADNLSPSASKFLQRFTIDYHADHNMVIGRLDGDVSDDEI